MLEEDRPFLQKLAKECNDTKEYRIYPAPLAVSEGYKVSSAAEIFWLISLQSAGTTRRQWNGGKGLAGKPKSGRPPVFTEAEKKDIKHRSGHR
ncbi:MAG: hypothetical protein M1331_00545 [Candidatus Marsarchaeota archaeon]|nr:hypothetical protein [Candidatus Marsarchaeota archaeon]MCL5105875.1 hypothetical protein [Candidatus Marsarchaeota archaeon]